MHKLLALALLAISLTACSSLSGAPAQTWRTPDGRLTADPAYGPGYESRTTGTP